MMWPGGDASGFWAMSVVSVIFGLVVTIGVVVLIVLGIRWLIRADQRSRYDTPPGRPDDPLEILRQRYARGEIDEDEYDRRRRTLSGG